MNTLAARIALVAFGLGAAACSSSQVCVPDAQWMQCRCGDGTYGYLACNATGTYADPNNAMHCVCNAALSPDGSTTLVDASATE